MSQPRLSTAVGASESGQRLYAYRVFGGVLLSELPFPELEAAPSPSSRPDWTLRVRTELPALDAALLVGEERLIPGVTARLERNNERYRLSLDDSGVFEVAAAGRELAWYPRDGAHRGLVRLDILGRVFAIAAHAAGAVCLHASAVVIAGRAVAFVAPKGFGKSTIAMALLQHGAHLLTDDTLSVEIGNPPRARPGVHGLRLHDDSAEHFASEGSARRALTMDRKLLASFEDRQLARDPAPLDAVYVLNPTASGRALRPVSRALLTPMERALALVAHGKISALLTRGEAATALARATALAGRVPVYSLRVLRDFDQLDASAQEILGWHAAGAADPASGDGP